MSAEVAQPKIIWATRGHSWGFRFLRNGGLSDPLPQYEAAFAELRDAPTAWRRQGNVVALRILDPLDRRDAAGRPIPHEFVIFDDLAIAVNSIEDGLRLVWPLVSDAFARVWDAPSAPPPEDS